MLVTISAIAFTVWLYFNFFHWNRYKDHDYDEDDYDDFL
jgi:hypothetical protein